ncbi:MAG: BON domain-containing protein [Proteobacteria bacterium]|nr:BON domain-containing protein [Pseudomonadota bacterium]MBU1389180.1 BON domain-containing protein [Pseudomonadota bacterium]MBU1543404.1 BON domain-containing protein [Pseudomonadota bacterium]MBU2482901.1 BON domain-containing protein [Pseudomonadota bacterium]
MKHSLYCLSILLVSCFLFAGCGAAVLGGAAYGGYKGVTDKRTVGTMFDDTVISSTVKTKMISDEFVKARHIDVDVLNSVVYLIGVVESESQKRMAADIARSVDGVKNVENQLMVGKTTAGQTLNDAILTSKIKTQLVKDPDIRSTNIDVDTTNNVVTLTGILASEKEKSKAIGIVQKVSGKKQVIDNLKVKN